MYYPPAELTPEIPNLTFPDYPQHPLSRSDSFSFSLNPSTSNKPLSNSLDLAHHHPHSIYSLQHNQQYKSKQNSKFTPNSPFKM